MPIINTQILITNLKGNFSLDVENETTLITRKIIATRSFDFIESTRSIGATSFTKSTSGMKFTRSTISIRSTKNFSILENVTQQLLDNKHIFTLGQLFRIVPNLKQYVAKLAPGRKNITITRLNLVVDLMAINPHMAMIQVHVGKNIIEDVILDGGSNMNIMTKEFRKWFGLPNPKPTPYTL
jgi:hypothetical protein